MMMMRTLEGVLQDVHNLLESWTGQIPNCWEWWRMWPGGSALQMRCFMQANLEPPPQLERGALGSAVIAGGVEMKLLEIWFFGNQSMAKGASEDRLAHLSICWRRTPRSPETACWQRWMTGLAGEREPLEGSRCGWGVYWVQPSSSRSHSSSSRSSSSRKLQIQLSPPPC